MARDEYSEKAHFNSLFSGANLDGIHFSPDLSQHVDNAILKAAIAMLGNLQGKRILLFGCGSGQEAWYLAEHGADVVGIDISFNYLRIAASGAKRFNYSEQTRFSCMSGYTMAFKDQSFDLVFGHAILHHLDPILVGREIPRILVPDGIAIFSEPLNSNPFLRFARNHLPYP